MCKRGTEKETLEIPQDSQLIVDKGGKAIHWRKDVFLTNGAQTTGHPHAKKKQKQKTNSRHRSYTFHKN